MGARCRTAPLAGWVLITALSAAIPGITARADVTSASSLDDTDKAARQDALDRLLAAAPGDQEIWSNIDSGHSGTVKSVSERPSGNGETCRDLVETVSFADGQSTGTLVACRVTGRPWRIVTQNLDAETQAPSSGTSASQPPGPATPPVQVWIGVPRNGAGTTTTVPSTAP